MKRQVRLLQVDNQGRVTELQKPITDLKEESRLHMRELLIVEQPSAIMQPRILPRRHCILLTVGHVRGLIFVDRVYLFWPQLPQVQQYAKQLAAHVIGAKHGTADFGASAAAGGNGTAAQAAATAAGQPGAGGSSAGPADALGVPFTATFASGVTHSHATGRPPWEMEHRWGDEHVWSEYLRSHAHAAAASATAAGSNGAHHAPAAADAAGGSADGVVQAEGGTGTTTSGSPAAVHSADAHHHHHDKHSDSFVAALPQIASGIFDFSWIWAAGKHVPAAGSMPAPAAATSAPLDPAAAAADASAHRQSVTPSTLSPSPHDIGDDAPAADQANNNVAWEGEGAGATTAGELSADAHVHRVAATAPTAGDYDNSVGWGRATFAAGDAAAAAVAGASPAPAAAPPAQSATTVHRVAAPRPLSSLEDVDGSAGIARYLDEKVEADTGGDDSMDVARAIAAARRREPLGPDRSSLALAEDDESYRATLGLVGDDTGDDGPSGLRLRGLASRRSNAADVTNGDASGGSNPAGSGYDSGYGSMYEGSRDMPPVQQRVRPPQHHHFPSDADDEGFSGGAGSTMAMMMASNDPTGMCGYDSLPPPGTGTGSVADASGNVAAAAAAGGEQTPFEMSVLEHALMSTYSRQAKRVWYARHLLETLLSKMGTVERDDGRWAALFPLSNTLNHYEMLSKGLMECVRALLDDDRDMRETCLTEKAKISSKWASHAAVQSRSHADAYDPLRGGSTGNTASGLSPHALAAGGYSADMEPPAHTILRRLSPRSLISSADGTESFLGHAASPISSHRHVSRLITSNPAMPSSVGAAVDVVGSASSAASGFSSFHGPLAGPVAPDITGGVAFHNATGDRGGVARDDQHTGLEDHTTGAHAWTAHINTMAQLSRRSVGNQGAGEATEHLSDGARHAAPSAGGLESHAVYDDAEHRSAWDRAAAAGGAAASHHFTAQSSRMFPPPPPPHPYGYYPPPHYAYQQHGPALAATTAGPVAPIVRRGGRRPHYPVSDPDEEEPAYGVRHMSYSAGVGAAGPAAAPRPVGTASYSSSSHSWHSASGSSGGAGTSPASGLGHTAGSGGGASAAAARVARVLSADAEDAMDDDRSSKRHSSASQGYLQHQYRGGAPDGRPQGMSLHHGATAAAAPSSSPPLWAGYASSADNVLGYPPLPGSGPMIGGIVDDFQDINADDSIPPILRVSPDALSQLELMLESIYHRAAENTMNIAELSKTLSNKQDLLELQQSNYRNFILSISLRMSIIGAASAVGTFVTSAFGMNIANGLENNRSAFFVVTGVSIACGFYVYQAVSRLILTNSPTKQYARRLQAFQDLLFKLDSKVDSVKSALAAAKLASSMNAPMRSGEMRVSHPFDLLRTDDVEFPAPYVPTTSHTGGETTLTKPEFRRLYEKYTGREMTQEELDLLFDLLDANGDGVLQLREVAGIFQQHGDGGGAGNTSPAWMQGAAATSPGFGVTGASPPSFDAFGARGGAGSPPYMR